MTIIPTSTAAAVRARTLSTHESPFAVPVGVAFWRQPVTNVPASAVMCMTAVRPILADHNSIAPVCARTTDLAVAASVQGVYGAAKQAAPPRGVPR